MYGINRRRPHHLQCLVDTKFIVLDVVYQTLKIDQSGVSFVAMIHILLDTKSLQSEYTAYSEHYLLFETIFVVAAI